LITACGDDDDPQNLLSYDGENVTGPLLQAGTWEAAVRFTTAETTPFTGQRLTEVTFYMGPAPSGAAVRIYGPGSNNLPGSLLYTAEVGNAIRTNSWNTHTIASPIEITGEELWISIGLVHQGNQQSIGCDAGPAATNGDWLFWDGDGDWQTYRARTNESVNWNIRGIVEE